MELKKVICMQCHNACRLAAEVEGDRMFPVVRENTRCNVLKDDDPDICNPISGGWPLRTLLCKVTKAPEQ